MQTKKTIKPGSWAREFKHAVTRNLGVKIIAVVIASLFWHMVKQQIRPSFNQRDFLEEHSLGNAAGIGPHPGR